MNRPEERPARPGLLSTFGSRLVGFTGILVTGTAFGLVLAVVRIAVLTRLLEMSVYGQFTLLIIMAGLVTVICRMTVVTGTVVAAFRGGDDDEGAVDEEELAEEDPAEAGENSRRVLGTGLVASLTLAAIIAVVAAAFSESIAEVLMGTDARFVIVVAVILGGLDATYHLTATIARLERRAVTFVVLQAMNGIFGLIVAATAIQAGYGLEGAVGGLALGTALALVPAIWVSRHRFSLSLSMSHVGDLVRKGAPLIPITIGFWVFRHADIFMVSRYLPSEDVALYRVAARVGAITSAAVGGVLLARGPLLRGPLRGALHRKGLLVAADTRVVTYIWLASIWMLVGLFLTRHVLVRVAPPEYESAAGFIPVLGLAALATTALTVVFRTSRMKRKRHLLIALLMLMSPMLVVISILLIPRLGLEGAAIAAVVPPVIASAAYMAIAEYTSKDPLNLPWPRLILAALVGVGYCAVGEIAASALGDAGIILTLVMAVAFPLLLLGSGILRRDEARQIASLLPFRTGGRQDPRERIATLSLEDVEVLTELVRRRTPVRKYAAEHGIEVDEALKRLVKILRALVDREGSTELDVEFGRYLLSGPNVNQRDREGHQLALKKELDSAEVDQLTNLTEQIRAMNNRRWQQLTNRSLRESEASMSATFE